MKLIILRNNFKEIITIAERLTGENLNLPILKNFLLEARNNEIEISSTNLELGITVTTSAKIIEPGKVSVPAALLSSIISNLTSERLNIEKKGSVLDIKADNYEAEIPLSSHEEFPIIPKTENKKHYIEISSNILHEALGQVSTAIQFSDFRPEISGVLFDFSLDNITMVGTDSFRLAEKKISKNLFHTNHEEGFKNIIPLKTVQEIVRIFKKDTPVSFYFDPNQVMVKTKDCELISRLIDGNFPDYQAIIPKIFETNIEVDREELMNALKLSGAVSSSVSEVKLRVNSTKKNLEILSNEKNFGKTKSLLPAKIIGEHQDVLFNWKYLFDGLKCFADKTIILGLNGNTKPAMIKSSDNSYTYILMPIKE